MSARNAAGRLIGFFAGGFIAGFNENLVNMALVAIMGEFSVDAMTAQWLVTGFMVVTVFVVAAMAALYRRLGPRTLLFVALACNALGSMGGLVAPTFAVLFASRLVQAVGTGIFIPLMMNAILETVASEKLGTYLAVGNGMIALGPAVAPVATGALVGAFGWHSVFVVPLVASALIGLWGLVAVRPSRRGDVQGNFVSLRGVLLNRGFVAAALLVVLTMSIYFSLNVMGPLYLEECAHLGPALSGLCLGPLVVAYAVASLAGGRRLDRRGPAPLLSSRLGRGGCWIGADGRSRLDGKRDHTAGGDVGGVCRLRHGVRQFPDYRAAVPGAEPALPGRHHNDDGRPNCCFYRTVCPGGHNVGHPRCGGGGSKRPWL